MNTPMSDIQYRYYRQCRAWGDRQQLLIGQQNRLLRRLHRCMDKPQFQFTSGYEADASVVTFSRKKVSAWKDTEDSRVLGRREGSRRQQERGLLSSAAIFAGFLCLFPLRLRER